MKKLNELRTTNHIEAYGYQALRDFAETSNPDGATIVVSSLSPAVMLGMGIAEFCAPIMPRGLICQTAQDVEDADLSLNLVTVECVEELPDMAQVIVSRHPDTIDVLRGLYPGAEVLTGNVSAEDVCGKLVIGTLPPALVAECGAYRAATIDGFDHAKDGDLAGDALKERLHVSDPITVTVR